MSCNTGVAHGSLGLIKSYLNNCYQYVQFQNCKSNLLEVKGECSVFKKKICYG